jgi:hypothetical protein
MSFNEHMKEQMELQFAFILLSDLIDNKYSLIEDYKNDIVCCDDYAHAMGMINETLDKIAPIPHLN